MTTTMLDFCICSFIMREYPDAVIKRLAAEVGRGENLRGRIRELSDKLKSFE